MTQTAKQGMGTMAKAAIAMLAGFVVFLLLVPSGGVDSQSPVCSSRRQRPRL